MLLFYLSSVVWPETCPSSITTIKLSFLPSTLQAKLAAMTPDEQAEFERERANEERREARKARMLQSSMGSYATANVHKDVSCFVMYAFRVIYVVGQPSPLFLSH